MPKTIIIIDDSHVIRQQVRAVLGEAGYEILEAEDGAEGAAAIRANPTASLAICDVNMPHVGGLEMLELLNLHDGHLSCPILMLTTEGRPEVAERARASGAKGWIVKPVKPPILLSVVRRLAGSPCDGDPGPADESPHKGTLNAPAR
jgi:two-component system, chemotaxis family, chemotaxis protein CheY